MKYLSIFFFAFIIACPLLADNFVLRYGEAATLFSSKKSSNNLSFAEQLLQQDYQEVFGHVLSHTVKIEEAKIIACSYDAPDLQKYIKLRGLDFSSLKDQTDAFIYKVHNNGRQLFVVGSNDQATAFGLMTLSRLWGVSPFCWWDDAPPLSQDTFELGVAYEHLFKPSIPSRILIIPSCQPENARLQEIALRLRVNNVVSKAVSVEGTNSIYRLHLHPSYQPYLGLSLSLMHPEKLRIESLRAYNHGCNQEWQLLWDHQFGGELQTLLFFDMAWDIDEFTNNQYAVDELIDNHFNQMSGLNLNWSRFWNEYFDLLTLTRPEQPQSLESLRRTIGETQQLSLQLSLDMSEHAVPSAYANSFYRTVEYPVNMAITHIQRLCNIQLVRHEAGNAWVVDDCRQRMELLASQLPDMFYPKWRDMMNGVQYPSVIIGQSLMQQDGYKLTNLTIGSDQPLTDELGTEIFYRSKSAVGTAIEPYKAFHLPLSYQSSVISLRVSLLPTCSYGSPVSVLVYVDNLTPQLLTVDADNNDNQQLFDLLFNVDPTREKHDIVFRTTSDGIFLQRVWICDMK